MMEDKYDESELDVLSNMYIVEEQELSHLDWFILENYIEGEK